MKPPRFDYTAPSTLDEALSELSGRAGDARPLAGGQSLVPLLNFRLSAPEVLVDLCRIPELVGTTIDASVIAVRAMTPMSQLIGFEVAAASPLVSAAARFVGHPQIRSRGTVGGSIAHADPAAELPAVAVLTDAVVELTSARGRREVAAGDFFHGLFATACEWDELVTGVRFPLLPDGAGWGFQEFARRPGDFAIAGVGAMMTLTGDTIESIAVVAFGVGAVPIRAHAAEAALRANAPTPALVAEAGAALVSQIDPADTVHGSRDYRRQVTRVLFERVIGDALRGARAAVNA